MVENMLKRSQAEKATVANENDAQIDPAKVLLIETTKFNLLNEIADNLEIDKLEKNVEDQTEGFVDKVKKVIKELFEKFKDRLDPSKEKGKFVRAIMKIFSILLNSKADSTEKLKKNSQR